MSTLNAKVILNVKTAAEWANSMEILLEGELGIESDTRLIKIGNGVDTFISLPYTAVSDISGIEGVTITSPTDGQVLTYSNGEWINVTPSTLPADMDLSHYDNSTSGFITASDIPALPADTDLSQYDNTTSDFATVSQIPTDVSQLNNDAGYITSASIPSVGDGTVTIQKNSVNVDSFTTNQNTNKTINITVPTLLSELSNDVGYITSATLPTVNDATLTIQRNGTTIGTFTANAATNATINISVPTSFSDLTSAGDLLPSVDIMYNLGSSSYRWSTGYINTIESTSINTANVKITGSLTVGIPSDVSAYKRITIKGYDGNTEGTLTDWAWLGWVNTGVFGFRPITSNTGTIGTRSEYWNKGYFTELHTSSIYSSYDAVNSISKIDLYYNTNAVESAPVQWGTMGYLSSSDIGIFPNTDNSYKIGATGARFKEIWVRVVQHSDKVHTYSQGNNFAVEWYNNSASETRTILYDTNDVYPYQNNTINLGRTNNRWNTIYYNTLNPPSDIRLKENIEPLDSGLKIVNDLDIKSFTFKNSPDHIEYGVIAQDVVEKYPELISVPDSKEGTYGTYLHNFIFASLRAIQELSSKVDELNAKIKILEAKL